MYPLLTHTYTLSLCCARFLSDSFLSSCRASDVTHWTISPISYHFSHPPELSSHHRSFRRLYIESTQIDLTIHPDHILFIKRQCQPACISPPSSDYFYSYYFLFILFF
ncbi:hypothetical protein CSKR_200946 [Clonorchis sinensis]|uniref:Uncharacterized protein n=1 Tax=Clonorchis sinensis TaxID=79923 RepID=A0A8T1MIZ5_CLOSI|nr:hypothetical protein CSKR_200946 [Clonorchis sinensis]